MVPFLAATVSSAPCPMPPRLVFAARVYDRRAFRASSSAPAALSSLEISERCGGIAGGRTCDTL
jgi:hypothetical protein